MIELSVDISKLPTIPDTDSWETFVNGAKQKYIDISILLRAYWRDYQNWIILCMALLTITVFGVLIIIVRPDSPAYPCLMYQADTMASTVSVECLQYIWNGNCRLKTPYLFPQSYTGWWKLFVQALSSRHRAMDFSPLS